MSRTTTTDAWGQPAPSDGSESPLGDQLESEETEAADPRNWTEAERLRKLGNED